MICIGGEREIRTRDKVTPVPPFQGGDLNRSSSSPQYYYDGAITACRLYKIYGHIGHAI